MDKLVHLLGSLILALGFCAAAGCNAEGDPPPDPDTCEAPARVLLYTSPGCGADVKPSCISGGAGACARPPVCGCDGNIVEQRCDGAVARRFQYRIDPAPGSTDATSCTKPADYTPEE
jgi:hypothetical protein